MKRRVCVVTGSRAEFGLLRWVMAGIRASVALELQVVVTGAHMSAEFGDTYRDIEADGFRIDRKVDMRLDGDAPAAIARAMGQGLIGFGEVFAQLRPDLLLVLGDRYEILPPVAAALVARIPVAHAHGGETTAGAFDESLRHAITKMSHLHFVAAEEYRARVIQLGEQPDRVFLVGGLGLDNIRQLVLLDREQLEEAIDFRLGARNLLVTFHPATAENAKATDQMTELLSALDQLTDTHLIFTMPNADPGGRELRELVERFVAGHPNARSYTSLGQLRYLSCLQHVDGVVGNSSSGLIEAPSFQKGTINIGNRQQGRLKAASIIDCRPERSAIASSLRQLYDPRFQSALPATVNPYGDGGASERIVGVLERVPLESLVMKSFHDLTMRVTS